MIMASIKPGLGIKGGLYQIITETDAFLGENFDLLTVTSPCFVIFSPFAEKTANEMVRSDDPVTWNIWAERVVSQRISN